MKKTVKKKTWTKKRHRIIKRIVAPFFDLVPKKFYHCDIIHFPSDGRNYLVLSNHQTVVDQYIVSAIFKEPVYFVAMEDLFSKGFFSRFLEWTTAPVPILKGTTDVSTVRNCIKIAKEGGTIVLFPEGNRTYNGKTCYIGPQVAKLIKLLRIPVAFVRIEGGYGVRPRWSDHIRNGSMKAGVTKVIEPELYQEMENDALYDLICDELYVDDNNDGKQYSCTGLAEGLERVLYYCPKCSLTEFKTENNKIICSSCGSTYTLNPDQTLDCPDDGTSFKNVSDWYDSQEQFIKKSDPESWSEHPAFVDVAKIYEVIINKHKKIIERCGNIKLFGDRIEIIGKNEKRIWYYKDIKAMTCVGCHKLNIYLKNDLYQFSGNKHYNALKYCNFYYHYKYLQSTHLDGEFEFLGL